MIIIGSRTIEKTKHFDNIREGRNYSIPHSVSVFTSSLVNRWGTSIPWKNLFGCGWLTCKIQTTTHKTRWRGVSNIITFIKCALRWKMKRMYLRRGTNELPSFKNVVVDSNTLFCPRLYLIIGVLLRIGLRCL